ncbi:MAG: asparagine synthetase B, partial [Parafilimonas sp.]
MCGIAGFVDFNKNTSAAVLQNMTDVLTHRGPNDSGYEVINNSNALIGLGQRRLSIIDLSANGKQPMQFDNLSIIFNGEIYNYQAIRDELIMEGYSFNSTSDTEVI